MKQASQMPIPGLEHLLAKRQYQGWLWKGTKVHNTSIKAGDILDITTSELGRTTLKYPVAKVKK